MTRVLRASRRWCFQVKVLWVVTPCSVVVVYRRFNGVITQKTSVSRCRCRDSNRVPYKNKLMSQFHALHSFLITH
jgi:hypothetical protein